MLLDRAGQPSLDEVDVEVLEEVLAQATLQEIDGRPWASIQLTQARVCTACDIEYPPPEARLFSFNSPLGACPKMRGIWRYD